MPTDLNLEEAVLTPGTERAMAAAEHILAFLLKHRGADAFVAGGSDFLAGNPQELAMPAYVAAVQRALVPDRASYYAYGPPWQPAVDAVAAALAGRLDLDLDVRDVFLTRGAASGLQILLRLLVGPGDEVMMMSPPWFFYEPLVLAEGAEPVKVPLVGDAFDLDVAAIERAITAKTRVVVVNTPHNPSGRIYPAGALTALAAALEDASSRYGRRIYLISDEAYARILFDGNPMLTPGRFYPATFLLHTYSKSLLAPSQRAGYLAMAPGMPHRERLRTALFWGSLSTGSVPDTAMQHAMPELEEMCIDVGAIERRRDRLVAELRQMGYEVGVPEGAFYLFPRSPVPDAIGFCDRLAEGGVLTLPGEAFERPGHFRLSLTATDAMVDRALPVLAEAIGARA